MLYLYKDDYEKIAMGLFSYAEHLKDPQYLTDEIEWYQAAEERYIYLWKSSETDDFVGAIGLEADEDLILIRLITVLPSYRNEGIAGEMLTAIDQEFPDKKIVGTLETTSFVSKWEDDQQASDE